MSAAACVAPENDSRDFQTDLAAEEEIHDDFETLPPSSALQIGVAPDAEAPTIADLVFPHVVQPACPGEGCMYDEWLACDAVPVYPNLGGAGDPVMTLTPNSLDPDAPICR